MPLFCPASAPLLPHPDKLPAHSLVTTWQKFNHRIKHCRLVAVCAALNYRAPFFYVRFVSQPQPAREKTKNECVKSIYAVTLRNVHIDWNCVCVCVATHVTPSQHITNIQQTHTTKSNVISAQFCMWMMRRCNTQHVASRTCVYVVTAMNTHAR